MQSRAQGLPFLDVHQWNTDFGETARRLAELGNLTPSLSVEGLSEQTDQRRGSVFFNRVLDAMTRLRRWGSIWHSITATRSNCEQFFQTTA